MFGVDTKSDDFGYVMRPQFFPLPNPSRRGPKGRVVVAFLADPRGTYNSVQLFFRLCLFAALLFHRCLVEPLR